MSDENYQSNVPERKPIALKRRTIGAGILFVVALIGITFGAGFVGRNKVISNSMLPVLAAGDYVFVDQRNHLNFQRGDILVFEDPQTPKELVTKRLVGLPRERIEVEDASVRIDGRPYRLTSWKPAGARSESRSVKLGKNEYFMLGDNRLNSADSRIYGGVKRDRIRGRIFFIYWPPSRFGPVESVTAVSASESE